MSEIIWSDDAWNDYLYWQAQDKKTVKRINALIKDIQRNGVLNGIGKPEPLKGNLAGEYSRRIDDSNRLIYHMEAERLFLALFWQKIGSNLAVFLGNFMLYFQSYALCLKKHTIIHSMIYS